MKLDKIERECKTHGLTTFILEGRGQYRCRKCRSESVSKRRRKVKEQLVEYFGGACQSCGYHKCLAAMEFHHPDGDKEFGVAAKGVTISYERLKAEASKCVLLCCRCHREVHAGLIECPPIIIPDDPAW